MANTGTVKFNPGMMVQTAGVAEKSMEDPEFCKFVGHSLALHLAGDWGDVSEADKIRNNEALEGGERLLSAYHHTDGTKIWIITEWNRSVTTILFPEEY